MENLISVIDIDAEAESGELDISQFPAELRNVWPTNDMRLNDAIGSIDGQYKLFHAINNLIILGCRPVFTYNEPTGSDIYIRSVIDNVDHKSSIHDLRISVPVTTIGYNYELIMDNSNCDPGTFHRAETSLALNTLIYVIGFHLMPNYIYDWIVSEYSVYTQLIESNILYSHLWIGANADGTFVPTENDAYTTLDIGIFNKCIIHIFSAINLYMSVRYYVDLMHSDYNVDKLAEALTITPFRSRQVVMSKINLIYPDAKIASIFKRIGLPKIGTAYMSVIYSTLNHYRFLSNAYFDIDLTNINKPGTMVLPLSYANQKIDLITLEEAFVQVYGLKLFKTVSNMHNIPSFISKIGKDKYLALLEYINNRRYSYVANTCDHVSVYNLYKSATTSEKILETFELLQEFISNESGLDFISCTVCNQSVMCSHELIRYRYMIGDIKLYSDLIAEYKPYLVTDIEDVDFEVRATDAVCNVCGTILYNDVETDTDINMDTSIYIDNSQIWKIATHLFYNYTSFANEVYDKNTVIRMMVNTCMPILDERISRILDKSKIETYVAIDANLIYAAYLMNLEVKTKGVIKFDINKYYENIPIREKVKSKRLIDTHRIRLAYVEPPPSNERFKYIDIENVTMVRLICNYMKLEFGEKFINEYLNYNKPTNKKAVVALNWFEHLKPLSLPAVSGGKSKIFAPYDELMVKRSALEYYVSVLNFNCFLKFHQQIIDISFTRVPDNFDMYDPMYTPPIIAENIVNISQCLDDVQRFINCRPYYHLPVCDYNIRGDINTVRLADLYDVTGIAHVWDTVEYNSKTMVPLKNAMRNGKVTDMYSSKTKTKMSELSKVDNETVKVAYLQNVEIMKVVQYYSDKCPEGGNHAGKICSKCGYGDDTKKYYDKYKKKYEIDKKQNITVSIQLKPVLMSIDKVDLSEITNVKLDPIIDEIISKFAVSKNRVFIEHLGAIDGIRYENLVRDSHVPKYEPNAINNKVFVMKSYLLGYKEMLLQKKLKLSDNMTKFKGIFENILDSVTTFDIMQWMRFILYEDLLNLLTSDEELARSTLDDILVRDMSNCIIAEIEVMNAMEDTNTDQLDPTPADQGDDDDGDDDLVGDGGDV